MDIKENSVSLASAPDHWYYRSKLEAVEKLVAGVVATQLLDVGSGSGFFARELVGSARLLHATLVDPAYEIEHRLACGLGSLDFKRTIQASSAELVLMMDVLEHVDDDVGLVREYVDKVAHGTCFVVSVPAFNWMWSRHDDFLEHRRRYTLERLEKTLTQAGLRVELGCYFYAAVLPLAAMSRLASHMLAKPGARSQMRPLPKALNQALYSVCHAEISVFQANRTAGLSVFARAVKP